MAAQVNINVLRHNQLYDKNEFILVKGQLLGCLSLCIGCLKILAWKFSCPSKQQIFMEVEPVEGEEVEHDLTVDVKIVGLEVTDQRKVGFWQDEFVDLNLAHF